MKKGEEMIFQKEGEKMRFQRVIAFCLGCNKANQKKDTIIAFGKSMNFSTAYLAPMETNNKASVLSN